MDPRRGCSLAQLACMSMRRHHFAVMSHRKLVRQIPYTGQSRIFKQLFQASPRPSRSLRTHLTESTATGKPAGPTQLALLVATVGFVSLATYLVSSMSPVVSLVNAASTSTSQSTIGNVATACTNSDRRDAGLPRFRVQEVREHGPDSGKPWIIYGDKVYDITDWVPAHPGGQVILRAAGGSIEAYWDIFSIHRSQHVQDILSQYLIGFVDQADLVDGKLAREEIEDPFYDDPRRHPSLITQTSKPCNAETPHEALGAGYLTPNELFYVRNHMWVPKVNLDASNTHVLTVELLDGAIKHFTIEDLKAKFSNRRITATLQCSGNRRKHMVQGSGRHTNGLQWGSGAISNAIWEGVLLSEVLADAGFDVDQGIRGLGVTKHVHFSGLEAYSVSIPLKKALDPQGDVLLAYYMNGAPLPPDHGFPLRAIVPGHVAARSVKWLSRITLSEEESTSQWQRRDYKCFGPNEVKVDWEAAPSIQEMPVQSAITAVQLQGWTNGCGTKVSQGDLRDAKGPAQMVTLSGYAFSGGGRSIVRVDVSCDGGRSWTQARLLPEDTGGEGSLSPDMGHQAWAWKQWRPEDTIPLANFRERGQQKVYPADAKSEVAKGGHFAGDDVRLRCTTILVKATDDAYNTQPETHAATWNLRGNLATAWHRIQVCADCNASAV